MIRGSTCHEGSAGMMGRKEGGTVDRGGTRAGDDGEGLMDD